MNNISSTPGAQKKLQPSPKMPVIFVGHGSPMNAIEDNEFRQSWVKLGSSFGENKRWPKPQLILSISAHWLTRGWGITAMPNPVTIHDFGGFPEELFAQQYPAPGAPDLAKQISEMIKQPENGLGTSQHLELDYDQWGFDHGTWSVLKPMFPLADIPVVQMSMDYNAEMKSHFELGLQLSQLRQMGVLIIGSGNTVHNLRSMVRGAPHTQAFDWNMRFDDWVGRCIDSGNLRELTEFLKRGEDAVLAHPSYEHFLPILYTAGASLKEDCVEYFNKTYQAKSIAMRSVIWY